MSDRIDENDASLDAARLATVTDLLGGWVWETDAEHRFTYISDSFERFIGRSPAVHYGKTRQEIGNTCEPSQLAEFQRNLEARAPFSSVDFTRHEGSDVIHMRVTGKPVFDAGERFTGYRGVAYCTTAEVRERERRLAAERDQSELMTTLGAVVNNYPNAIVIFNKDLEIVFANASYYELLDVRKQEHPIGSTFQDLVKALIARNELKGDSPDVVLEHHVRMARSPEKLSFERSRPDGTMLQVQQFPLPCGGIARTFTDVTERVEDKWAIWSLKATVASLADKNS